MYLKCKYLRDNLDVDFYPNFLPPDVSQTLYFYLDQIIPHTSRRNSILFGNDGLIYKVTYSGMTTAREVIPWNESTGLKELKNLVESITGQKYSVCVIQRYPNGNVGIAPHRDKEMVLGTRIAGLSIGATRTIRFIQTPNSVDIKLPSGSLYVMNPPTNQKWLHTIIKEPNITEPRFSLTFRDYQ